MKFEQESFTTSRACSIIRTLLREGLVKVTREEKDNDKIGSDAVGARLVVVKLVDRRWHQKLRSSHRKKRRNPWSGQHRMKKNKMPELYSKEMKTKDRSLHAYNGKMKTDSVTGISMLRRDRTVLCCVFDRHRRAVRIFD